MVVGIGINTNQEIFDKEISNIASSIKKEFNLEIDSKNTIKEFCNLFEEKIIKKMIQIL